MVESGFVRDGSASGVTSTIARNAGAADAMTAPPSALASTSRRRSCDRPSLMRRRRFRHVRAARREPLSPQCHAGRPAGSEALGAEGAEVVAQIAQGEIRSIKFRCRAAL